MNVIIVSTHDAEVVSIAAARLAMQGIEFVYRGEFGELRTIAIRRADFNDANKVLNQMGGRLVSE